MHSRSRRYPWKFWTRTVTLAAALLGLAPLAAAPARAEPAMWVVKDADTTIYLLGTIHVLKSDTEWRSDKLQAAFTASDQYWMEADIEEDPAIAQTYALNFGVDSQHPLAEKLSPADYAQFLKLTAAMNIPEDRVTHMRPWLATMLLQRGAITGNGYDPKYGVDRALEDDAKAVGKPVKTFETPTQQLGFLAALSKPVELAMLEEALHEMHLSDAPEGKGSTKVAGTLSGAAPDDGGNGLDAMEAAWLAGDTEKLYALTFKNRRKKTPEFFDVIITKRNAAWLPQIEGLMKTPGTYFVAVGAGHLIGEGGLPVLLAKRGYRVNRY
jgi:uncharacterized protein YbaP (TraB family)